jgi:hypothetical protein
LTDFTDSPRASPGFSDLDGDDVDANMPTDSEASKYSFLDHLEHYMEWALIRRESQGYGACDYDRGRHYRQGDGSN